MKMKIAFVSSILFVLVSCNRNGDSLITNEDSFAEKKGEFLVDMTYLEPMLWHDKYDTPSRIRNIDSIQQIEDKLYGGEVIELYAVSQGFNIYDTFPSEIFFLDQPINKLSFKIVSRPSFIECVYKNNKFESGNTEYDINSLSLFAELGYTKCAYDENGNSVSIDQLKDDDILYIAINNNINDNKIYGIYTYNPLK